MISSALICYLIAILIYVMVTTHLDILIIKHVKIQKMNFLVLLDGSIEMHELNLQTLHAMVKLGWHQPKFVADVLGNLLFLLLLPPDAQRVLGTWILNKDFKWQNFLWSDALLDASAHLLFGFGTSNAQALAK